MCDKIKSTARLILATLFVNIICLFFSGCDDVEPLKLGNQSGGSGGFGGILVLPPHIGSFYADSVKKFDSDFITLYGHFAPAPSVVNRAIKVREFGFKVRFRDDIISPRHYPVLTDTVWQFYTADTVFRSQINIAPVTENVDAWFYPYASVVDNDGKVWHYDLPASWYLIQRYRYPYTHSITDSVTFLSSEKAVLWGHLLTSEDCEVRYSWFFIQKNPDPYPEGRYDTIWSEQIIKANSMIQFNDTISILRNSTYWWSFNTSIKFDNDSLATALGALKEFRTD